MSIRVLVLQNVPTLATSHSLLLIPLCFLLYVVGTGWAVVVPLSLTNVPDIQGSFSAFYLVSLLAVTGWLFLPRHFSVTDRYGLRRPVIELLDLCLMCVAIGLVMLAPFLTAHLVAARIAEMISTVQVLDDINDCQRAISYPLFRSSYLGGSRERYWGDASTVETAPTDGRQLRGIPGVLSGIDAISRSAENLRANKVDVIKSDVQRFLDVLHRYSPEMCHTDSGDVLTANTMTSDILSFREGFGDRSKSDDESKRETLRAKYTCISLSDVTFTTGQLLLSKSLYIDGPLYRDLFLMEYSLTVAVYCASFVFLMGTMTQKYLLWLAPWLTAFSLPFLGLFRRFSISDVPPFLFSAINLILYVFLAFVALLTIVRRRNGRASNVHTFASIAALPAVLFLAANVLALIATLCAFILPGRGQIGFFYGSPGTDDSRYSFVKYLADERFAIQWLAYLAIPYAISLLWLRNWLVSVMSEPGER